MATLDIGRLPEDVHAKLRVQSRERRPQHGGRGRTVLADAVQDNRPKPVDLASLRAFMLRLYDGELPTGAGDEPIAERRREARRELEK